MNAGQVVSEVEGRWPAASLAANARIEPDHRLRVEARARVELSALPGLDSNDAIDMAARAEGRWPHATFTAAIDLARPAIGATPAASTSDSTPSPESHGAGRVP